jgi:hypothetical protein
MRHLFQPRVLNQASLAAAVTALACYPRMSLWLTRTAPIWYLEAALFFCGIILWGFVFAWHPVYARKPVFQFKIEPKTFITVTLLGIFMAMVYSLWLDPSFRLTRPEEYPADMEHWLAFVAFALTFNQLFLIFAPFDWVLRLLKRPWLAVALTTLFGACVLMLNVKALPMTTSPGLLAALLACRLFIGFVGVMAYLRGGVLLTCWWTLILESRHLLTISGNH